MINRPPHDEGGVLDQALGIAVEIARRLLELGSAYWRANSKSRWSCPGTA